MRYYRLQRGFTTRQLADKLKTVPTTVLGYEQGKFPIPYDIAVALSEMLKMPRKTIFDDFCLFIDTPIQSGSIKSEKVITSVKLNFSKERILPQAFMPNGNPAIVAHHGKCTSD